MPLLAFVRQRSCHVDTLFGAATFFLPIVFKYPSLVACKIKSSRLTTKGAGYEDINF